MGIQKASYILVFFTRAFAQMQRCCKVLLALNQINSHHQANLHWPIGMNSSVVEISSCLSRKNSDFWQTPAQEACRHRHQETLNAGGEVCVGPHGDLLELLVFGPRVAGPISPLFIVADKAGSVEQVLESEDVKKRRACCCETFRKKSGSFGESTVRGECVIVGNGSARFLNFEPTTRLQVSIFACQKQLRKILGGVHTRCIFQETQTSS